MSNVISLCAHREKLEREEMEAIREELLEYIYGTPGVFPSATLITAEGELSDIEVEYPDELVDEILRAITTDSDIQ